MVGTMPTLSPDCRQPLTRARNWRTVVIISGLWLMDSGVANQDHQDALATRSPSMLTGLTVGAGS